MLSYAAGSRFLQLLGGVSLSFYDWYSDLPPASPEVWGEQTDVAESADWYNAKFIASVGSNMSMTRTPDVHFAAEARHAGTKLVVFSPDFSQVAKYADWWIPIHAGQDGAFWMAVNHVILQEFHYEQPTPYFLDYVQRYTDAPFLVVLDQVGDAYVPGRMLRAGQVTRTRDVENASWKFLVWDKTTNEPRMPQGSLGFRWQKQMGQWNLEPKDGLDGSAIDPQLTFLDEYDKLITVAFAEFAEGKAHQRCVPVHYVETPEGSIPVATIYDLLMAQYGVARGLPGDFPRGYDDAEVSYTPAWQERYHRRRPRDGHPVRARMGKHSRINRRQVHDHHRRGRQSLVSQQPDLPRLHRRVDADRLRRAKWRRSESLCRPGKMRPLRLLVDAGLWIRLAKTAPLAKYPLLPLRKQRPVALRAHVCRGAARTPPR